MGGFDTISDLGSSIGEGSIGNTTLEWELDAFRKAEREGRYCRIMLCFERMSSTAYILLFRVLLYHLSSLLCEQC